MAEKKGAGSFHVLSCLPKNKYGPIVSLLPKIRAFLVYVSSPMLKIFLLQLKMLQDNFVISSSHLDGIVKIR